MSTKQLDTHALSREELKAVYSISRVVLQTTTTRAALQEIIRISRPVFIFDNIVIYHIHEDKSLEPTYARSVGRGRSAEADMAWGETIAKDVVQNQEIIVRFEEIGEKTNDRTRTRLRLRYYLGLPLAANDTLLGALVFIRFGGPDYRPEQINLASFIAEHVTQLLKRQQLIEQIVRLETEQQLKHLQEDFVAAVSHDLRSPLGVIKGYTTSLLREDVKWDPKTQREFLTIIDEEADHLTALIDNLLNSSRLQAGTFKLDIHPIRLEALLMDAIRQSNTRGYSIHVQPVFKITKNRIWGDPVRLMQVFENILVNAHKYAPGSDVTVDLLWSPDNAHIQFRDTGPGIPSEYLEDIFKRFYQVPRENNAPQNGSGLGLYICREIVQSHNGEIYAESEPGKGTIMHIILPRNRPKSPEQETQP